MPRTRRRRALLGVCLLAAPTPAQDVEAAENVQELAVTWQGDDRTVVELAATRPRAADAARSWTPFAAARGYRLVLSDDCGVLLVLSDRLKRRKPRKEHREVTGCLELVAETRAAVDAFLGPPGESTGPLVVVGVRHRDYRELLEHIRARHEKLEGWATAAARSAAGVVLSDPLLAVWIEDPKGVDEWHPHNELVHRTAQLRIRQHAPHVPQWLLLGLSWHVEDVVRRSIYCFPHRAGFVSVGAHTDWGLWLANEFKKSRRSKKDLPPLLQVDEFADWNPRVDEGFDTGKAYVSFGVARYLAHEHRDSLAGLLKRLDAAIEKGRKVWVSDTEWRIDPDFRLSGAEQLAMLEQLQPDFSTTVTRWFLHKRANKRSPTGRRR